MVEQSGFELSDPILVCQTTLIVQFIVCELNFPLSESDLRPAFGVGEQRQKTPPKASGRQRPHS